jgi:NAD(P)H-dependent FMN reductase
MNQLPQIPALKVGIILGSTRPGRRCEAVGRWLLEQARRRDDATFELVDIADYNLPILDEPSPPIHGRYELDHTRAWSERIASFDAYIFVTPEYNRSIPGALKNAIDFLYHEWTNKAAGFVSYGASAGGVAAVEHLRGVMGELQVADVRAHVALSLFDDFEDFTTPAPQPHRLKQLDDLFDQVIAWGMALRALRQAAEREPALRGAA